MFLKISQIHKKAPVPDSVFNEVAGLQPAALLQVRPQRRYFPVDFAEFLIEFFRATTSESSSK